MFLPRRSNSRPIGAFCVDRFDLVFVPLNGGLSRQVTFELAFILLFILQRDVIPDTFILTQKGAKRLLLYHLQSR